MKTLKPNSNCAWKLCQTHSSAGWRLKYNNFGWENSGSFLLEYDINEIYFDQITTFQEITNIISSI